MNRKLYMLFAVLVVFAFTTSSTALAMPGAPIATPETQTQWRPNAYPQRASTPYDKPTTTYSGSGMMHAQAIAVGLPMAFRFDKTFGVTETAYPDDPAYLNGATGITMDDAGNMYVVEENGAKLTKYASDGDQLDQAGIAGMHDWGATGLNWPREIVFGPDGMLWVADNDSVARFNPADLEYLSRFPEKPWEAPDEMRFNELRGIAFDSGGRMFVSDRWRHRVQVFDTTGPEITFVATIGETDVRAMDADDDERFNEPGQVVVDSQDNLYVADIQTSRVQKCTPNVDFSDWNCARYTGTGAWGGGENEFAFVYGLGIGADDTIYITDNANGRVKACEEDVDEVVTCSIVVLDMNWPTDVTVDPVTEHLYVSIYGDFVINEYTEAGVFVRKFAGTLGKPYETDEFHLNGPRVVETDSKGNLYVGEEWGQRVIKYSSTGLKLWAKGVPGIGSMDDEDPDHISNPTAMAIDPAGKKLIVAESGWRIRFFDAATGKFLSVFSKDEDGYRFDYASGISYDRSGNLYISDRNQQVVRIYNKVGDLVKVLGEEYVQGPDSKHFNNPTGLTVDASGNLFVADHDNCRVQKFDKKYNFLMTFGTARCGGTYDRMGGPMDVAVDTKGNVYVVEEWNSRVSVYSSKGAYLGYIGSEWSGGTGGLRNPTGIAIDKKNNVYVADMNNARVQRFVAGVPYAAKISQDNFGGRDFQMIFSLAMFKGQLYAGTTRSGMGAQIWRQTKTGWEAVTMDGFEDGGNGGIDHLYEYRGYLYATTYHCMDENCTTSNGGQIWRSLDGATWEPVTVDGFGDPANYEIFRLGKLGTQLCAAIMDFNSLSHLWCSESGEAGTWTDQLMGGFMDGTQPVAILSLQEYKGAYFAAGQSKIDDEHYEAVVFRKTTTTGWETIPFPQGVNVVASDLAVYKDYLYAITHAAPENTAQILRCKVCDGTDWVRVDNGFGANVFNRRMGALEPTKSALYAVTGNMTDGLSVWKSTDGLKWSQVGPYGLGSSNNGRVYWGNSVTTNGTNLFLGTIANSSGGAVWKICSGSACK